MKLEYKSKTILSYRTIVRQPGLQCCNQRFLGWHCREITRFSFLGGLAVWMFLMVPANAAFAQKTLAPTSVVRVHGQLKKELAVTLPDLQKYAARTVGDVVITNHLGEPRGTARQMKGILLKDVLNGIEIDSPSPKDLSAFYLICRASDGYEVVFSWNEIFNSPTGDAVFLVTEKDGKKLSDMEDAILLISPTDMRTDRRFVKSLAEIEFVRVAPR